VPSVTPETNNKEKQGGKNEEKDGKRKEIEEKIKNRSNCHG